MTGLFRTTVVEISGVRTISGGGTNASNAGQALLNLGGVSITGDQTIDGTKSFVNMGSYIVSKFEGVNGNPLEIVTTDESLESSYGSSAYAIGAGAYGFAVKYTSNASDWGQPILVTEGAGNVVYPTSTITFPQSVLAPNLVYTTDNQTVSGIKTFTTVNESFSVLSITNQTINFPLNSGMNFILPLTTGITGITFSNTPTNTFGFTLRVDYSGTHAIVWPTGTIGRVLWPNNTAPTLTTTVGREDFFSFLTYTSGQEFFGFTAGQNYSGIY